MQHLRTIHVLTLEHECIDRMLDCFEHLLEETARAGRMESEYAAPLLAAFEYFADGLHQRKEEAVLFPRLLQLTDLEEKVYLARLHGEHEGERRLMRSLGTNLLGAIVGASTPLADFLRTGRKYLRLHREHVAKENHVVFPMVARLFDDEIDLAVVRGFGRLEEQVGIAASDVVARVDVIHERVVGPMATRVYH